MKNLNSFITEVKGEKAHRDAVAMGLKYKGFGYWVDPNTGQVTHKTENDTLVPVEPDVESELAGKDAEVAGMAGAGGASAGAGGMAVGGMASAAAMGMPDQSTVLGTADPEAGAQRPKEMDWEAGPDGDHCVGDQEPGEVPPDSYVGKTNYPNWTAGPDGSNFTNVDEGMEGPGTFTKQMRRNQNADGKIRDILNGIPRSAPGDITQGKMDRMKQREEQGELDKEAKDKKRKHARAVANRVRLGSLDRKMGNPADGPETKRDAEYLKNMKTGERTPNLQANLSAMGALRNNDPADGINQSVIDRLKAIKSGDPEEVKKKVADEVQAQYDRENEAEEGQITKDRELVDQMNKEARPMFSDPSYDLDDEGEELGEGAFGSVFMGPDGKSVIKEGQIGPEEMIAMMKLKDHPGFPTLINGRFERPFAPFSAYENNPGGRESGQRNTNWRGKPAYKNPEKASDFDDRFPGAQGRYAMSLAEGQTLDDYFYENGEEDAPEIFKNILKLRRDMHKTGIAHNDMHGGNIFVGDDGTPSIIDMGLAQDNPLAALMEGMGFVSGHDGQFNMGAAPGGMLNQVREFVNPDLMKKLTENRDQISRSLFRDEVDDEIDDWDDDDFDEMMGGGVRKTQDELEKLQRFIPRLKEDPEFVMSLIDRLYQGLDDDGDGVIEPEEIKKAEIGGFEGALGKLRGLGVGKVDNDD